MTPCANGHAPILHDEFHCPLCAALEDADGYEDAVQQAEDTIIALRDIADETGAADVLQLLAEIEELTAAKGRLESACRRLEWAIRGTAGQRPLGKRLARIEHALIEARKDLAA